MATPHYVFFTPTVDGQVVDVASTGGTVDYMFLYPSPDDRDAGSNPAASIDSAIPTGDGSYRFTLPEVLPDGRYWMRGSYRLTLLDDPIFQSLAETLDYPIDNPPLVRPEELATLLGLTIPLDATLRVQLSECIADAQSVVELAIGSVIPKRFVLTGAYYDDSQALNRDLPSTWFADTTNIIIESWQANFDGTYDVTYWYGFDGRNETPIKRFVIRYAAAWWRKAFGGDQSFGQVVSSISTEGQSVSYSSKERSADIDTSIGMSLQALIDRYGSVSKANAVSVFQRRNQYYGEDRTYWAGSGYDELLPWWY